MFIVFMLRKFFTNIFNKKTPVLGKITINSEMYEKTKECLIVKSYDESAVFLATKALKEDQIVAVPTDTIYGLACNANSQIAIKKLYSMKGRQKTKPLAICVGNLKQISNSSETSGLEEILDQLLPGPVTVVLRKSQNFRNQHFNPGISNIGVRIPKSTFIQQLCSKCDFPLALTSANVSNELSSLNIDEFKILWPRIDIIVDGGTITNEENNRAGSTIVDLSLPGYYKILRKGVNYLQTKQILHKNNLIELHF